MAASKTFSRSIDLRYYLHQIRKRLWLVILIALVGLAVGAYQVLSTRPLYRATAKLLVNEKRVSSNVVPFRDPLDPGGRRGGFLGTQVKVLHSPALVAEVISQLGLETHPEFVDEPNPFQSNVKKLAYTTTGKLIVLLGDIEKQFLTKGGDAGTDDADAVRNTWVGGLQGGLQRLQDTLGETKQPIETVSAAPSKVAQRVETKKPSAAFISKFLRRLQVRSEPASDVINVTFHAHDASLTAEVVNTLAHLYIEFARDLRFSDAQEAVDWLKARAAEMQKKVEESELELERYKEKHDVYSIEDRIAGITQELTALEVKVAEVRTERIELETLHRELEETADNPQILALFPSLGDSERMRDFKKGYEQLELQLLQLRKRYGPGHPQVGKLRAEMGLQQQKIDDEIDRAISASAARYELIKAREASMVKQFDKLKGDVRALNKIAIGYGTLERDAQSNRRLGDMMLTRLKEASLTPTLQGGMTAKVIGAARVPRGPINYQPTKSMMTAGLVGLVIGLGLVASLGYLNNKLETPQEAEEYLGLSVIGLIGQFKSSRKIDPAIDKNLFVLQAPRSQTAEAFKSLRTNMLFSYADSPRKVFIVTSSTPNEGKTTISANLAIVMAQLDHKVLLIEADLRNPSLATVFNIEGQTGLSALLLEDDYDSAAQLFEGNLSVVPAGEPPPNPAELLGSRRMQRYLEHVKELYDIIIIDTPPVLAVSDALVLNPIVDGTLLVLRASATTYDQVQRSISMIVSLKSDLMGATDRETSLVDNKDSLGIGLVMNFLDLKVGKSYGYYGHYGNYYYHDG